MYIGQLRPTAPFPQWSSCLARFPLSYRSGREDAAVRMVREMTGLDTAIVREFVTFIQPGTPTGTMCAHGYIARVTGGTLTDQGPEGPARTYPLDALPAIMPIRLANQRVLDAYLKQRSES